MKAPTQLNGNAEWGGAAEAAAQVLLHALAIPNVADIIPEDNEDTDAL